jgi:hypothetical protein
MESVGELNGRSVDGWKEQSVDEWDKRSAMERNESVEESDIGEKALCV